MAVLTWSGGVEQCFKDAATPLIYDAENEAWKDSTGLAYNKEDEAWEEKWSGMGNIFYENGKFGLAGIPEVFRRYYPVGSSQYTKGYLKFNSDNFNLIEGKYYNHSEVIFPNLIDFSKYKYIYVEGKASNGNFIPRSTNHYGDQGAATSNGVNGHQTTSISNQQTIETTSRGSIVRGECTTGQGYLIFDGKTGVANTTENTVTYYRIWLEK